MGCVGWRAALFLIPRIGPVLVGGPLGGLCIVGGLEGAAITGGLGVLGVGFYSLGIPKNSILNHETPIKYRNCKCKDIRSFFQKELRSLKMD